MTTFTPAVPAAAPRPETDPVAAARRATEAALAAAPPAPDRPWNLPGLRPALPGAIAQGSIRIPMNFMAGAWVDLFARGDQLGPKDGWASFDDAVAGAGKLTRDSGAIAIFQGDHGRGFFARNVFATDIRTIDNDPAKVALVPFDPRAWNTGDPDKSIWPREVVGVHALDHAFRGVVAGKLVPQVGPLG